MRLGVDVATLREVLGRELAARRPARLSNYLDAPPGPECFTVSFDDAHASVLTLAAPLLRELGIPATLFVPTAWVGTGPEWLDEAGLRALRDLGWEIGAHTVSHPRMSVRLFGEDDVAHARRLEQECERSRHRLGEILGVSPRLFAYPYGEDPPLARAAARSFGASFSVRDALTLEHDLEWDGELASVPRMDALEATGLVPLDSPEPLGISVIVPVRDRSSVLREVVRRWTAQSYPGDRFEVIVVDDGSRTPIDLVALVDDLEVRAHVRVLRVSEPERPFRAGQARNAGVAAARFPIVQLADSDVAVDGDFLWAVDWVHRRNRDCVLLGAISGYNLHDLGRVHALASVTSAEDLRTVAQIPDRQREPVVRSVIDNVDWLKEPWRLFYTGNVSFPRALFERVGGFEDAFSGWGLEDLDLGLRMHRAGATFVYSRFAVGLHVEDEEEARPRNPFRRRDPTHADFEGYLANLETWRGLHPSDPAVEGYASRTRADIEETSSRPNTVGLEMGGEVLAPAHGITARSPLHHEIHRTQPGGVPLPELLERVAYASKVGAKRLWIQGGDPAVNAHLRDVLAAASKAGLRSGLQASSSALIDRAYCERLRSLGLDHVTLLVDPAHARLCPAIDTTLEAAIATLEAVGIHVGARVVARELEDALAGVERAHPLLPQKLRVALPEERHEELRARLSPAILETTRLEALSP